MILLANRDTERIPDHFTDEQLREIEREAHGLAARYPNEKPGLQKHLAAQCRQAKVYDVLDVIAKQKSEAARLAHLALNRAIHIIVNNGGALS